MKADLSMLRRALARCASWSDEAYFAMTPFGNYGSREAWHCWLDAQDLLWDIIKREEKHGKHGSKG